MAVDPVIPARARLPRSLGEDTAIRIPQCTHGPEDRGNLSDWFVAWPTVPGAVIPEGHAKGWRINGNTLISPAETRYVFGE